MNILFLLAHYEASFIKVLGNGVNCTNVVEGTSVVHVKINHKHNPTPTIFLKTQPSTNTIIHGQILL